MEKRAMIRHVGIVLILASVVLCTADLVYRRGTEILRAKAEGMAVQKKEEQMQREREHVQEIVRRKLMERIGEETEMVACGVLPDFGIDDPLYWGVAANGTLYIAVDKTRAITSSEGVSMDYIQRESGIDFPITKCVVLDGVTGIDRFALSEFGDLTEVELAWSVIDVGDMAFYECRKLEKVVIYSRKTQLYPESFYRCADRIRVVLKQGQDWPTSELIYD